MSSLYSISLHKDFAQYCKILVFMTNKPVNRARAMQLVIFGLWMKVLILLDFIWFASSHLNRVFIFLE